MDENTLEYDIVTSCTPQYLPGLVALRNSIELNMPNAKLTCFWYGQQRVDCELPERITYIEEAPMPNVLGAGEEWRHGLKLGPDMYARLLIPRYFKKRAFYVDVDCLVLNDFSHIFELDLQNHMTACVYRPHIGWVGGHKYDDMASGTFLVDCEKWRERKFTEECFDIMEKYANGEINRTFNVNVESVMSYAHGGHFSYLPPEFQNLTYYGALCKRDFIAHFAGPKPWSVDGHDLSHLHVNYRDLWQAYYEYHTGMIKTLWRGIPDERPENPWDNRKQV